MLATYRTKEHYVYVRYEIHFAKNLTARTTLYLCFTHPRVSAPNKASVPIDIIIIASPWHILRLLSDSHKYVWHEYQRQLHLRFLCLQCTSKMAVSSNLARMLELKRTCRSPLPERSAPTIRSKQRGSALEHILDMPQDILQHLLSMVDGHSILQFACTCRLLRPARAHISGLSFRGPCAGPVFAAMPGLTTLSWAIREEDAGLDLSHLVHLSRLSHLSITMGLENADPLDAPVEAPQPAAASDALLPHAPPMSSAFKVLPNVEELYLLLGNAAHWRRIEAALNQGSFPSLRVLRVLFTDFGSVREKQICMLGR